MLLQLGRKHACSQAAQGNAGSVLLLLLWQWRAASQLTQLKRSKGQNLVPVLPTDQVHFGNLPRFIPLFSIWMFPKRREFNIIKETSQHQCFSEWTISLHEGCWNDPGWPERASSASKGMRKVLSGLKRHFWHGAVWGFFFSEKDKFRIMCSSMT